MRIPKIFQTQKSQRGQTLVETVVGIFVLTIGISTAIGLANSVFISTAGAIKQLVAVGLAREGVEAVFNMRATNWLKTTLGQCYDYTSGSSTGASCRDLWLSPGTSTNLNDGMYDIQGAGVGGRSYTLVTSYTALDTADYWQFTRQVGGNINYRLNFDVAASTGVLYTTNVNIGVPSDYYREIVIEEETTSPYGSTGIYDKNIGPRLKIRSRVWWTDRGCAASATWPTSGKCRIELLTYMTNWRNY